MPRRPEEIHIESDRLSIKPFRASDADAVFPCITPSLTRWMSWEPPADREAFDRIWHTWLPAIAEGTDLVFAVRQHGSETFLGLAGLHHIRNADAELGIWIREDRHREGFGREAVGLLAQWASDALCIERFTYPVAEENYPSRRIAESFGGVVVARRVTPKYRSVVYRIPRQSTSRVLNVALRPATELDWEFVSAVQAQCMREYAERTWGIWIPEPRDNFRPDIHQIIQCDGAEVGCIALLDEPDALMLEKLYVLPSHQNRGIGTLLLERFVGHARASGKPIRLRVLRVNPARQLYERFGFNIDRSTEERHFMSYSVSASEMRSCEGDAIQLIPMLDATTDRHALFALYKLSLYEYIEQTFGWDEDFQQERFNTSYRDSEFTSVILGPLSAGYFALRNEGDAVHLSLLLLKPEFRNRGIGRKVMQTLMSRTAESKRALTFSCFSCNQAARRFYKKLGFQAVAEDEHFVAYRRSQF